MRTNFISKKIQVLYKFQNLKLKIFVIYELNSSCKRNAANRIITQSSQIALSYHSQ